jgi:sigma-B regulation protein RsbU (phosphoserine phosphatase)
VYTCPGALDALKLAESIRPDLAIVDIMMPQMDGFELTERLQLQSADTDVILMTGSVHEADEKLIKAVRGGAFYYINKPFDRDVLLTLVDRCLEQKRLAQAERLHAAQMQRQLTSASAFQRAMLPQNKASLKGFEISAFYHPCEHVAGDFFEYAASGDGAVTALIADVVGHGASAAMLTAVVKAAFHKARSENYHPAAVVERVGENMAAFASDQFLTLLCARLSKPECSIQYVNAGHTPGLLIDETGQLVDLDSTGPVISSALQDLPRPVREVQLTGKATLFLYTDGVVEAWNNEEEAFGEERMRDVVRGIGADGTRLIQAVYERVKGHMGGCAPGDDLTMLAVSCK